MGNYCSSNGHAYKLTHKTEQFSRQNEIANYLGVGATYYYQCFQYHCANCGKVKCCMVHVNIMDIEKNFPELNVHYNIYENDLHATPDQCIAKLSRTQPNAKWISVQEGWIQ